MRLRRTIAALCLLCAPSCDALFPRTAGPENCVVNPSLCDVAQGQVCSPVSERCETGGGCSSSAQCPSAAAAQCRSGACVPCDADTQCRVWSSDRGVSPALNYCAKPSGAGGNTCGQCVTNQHCSSTPDQAFCDTTTQKCRGCLAHSECDSVPGASDGVCRRPNDYPAGLGTTGSCLPTSSIAYLGNNPAGCETNSLNASTVSKPYCTLAVAIASGKPVIKALPSATPYPAIALTTPTVTLIGPGRSASPGATFPSVDLNGSGRLTLSDVIISASAGTAAVTCRGGGTLNLVAASVSGSVAGVDANDCSSINIERTRISTPGRLAIQVGATSTGTYRIVNTLVVDSGAAAMMHPIRLGLNASGVFAYNTVTRSQGSVQCLNPFVIENSILVMNGTGPVGCSAALSVTDDSVTLSSGSEPQLAPTVAARNLCVDHGTQPANGEIATDYFGRPRPLGKGWDKGHHELE